MNEIPTVNIVNEAIVVIINSVAGNLSRILPNIVFKVRMVDIDSFVDHSNDDTSAAGSNLPSLLGMNISPNFTRDVVGVELPGVLEVPHRGISGIIRSPQGSTDEVGLRIEHIGTSAECFDCGRGVVRRNVRETQTFDNLRSAELLDLHGNLTAIRSHGHLRARYF